VHIALFDWAFSGSFFSKKLKAQLKGRNATSVFVQKQHCSTNEKARLLLSGAFGVNKLPTCPRLRDTGWFIFVSVPSAESRPGLG